MSGIVECLRRWGSPHPGICDWQLQPYWNSRSEKNEIIEEVRSKEWIKWRPKLQENPRRPQGDMELNFIWTSTKMADIRLRQQGNH